MVLMCIWVWGFCYLWKPKFEIKEMNMVTLIQVMNELICMSDRLNNKGKSMTQAILSPEISE